LFTFFQEKAQNKYQWFGLGQCFNENTSEYTGEYNPIFYNAEKLELVDQGVFWYSLEPADKGSKSWDAVVPTICTWCKFSAKKVDERSQRVSPFYVFNTHWDHGVETRRNASYLLREYIEQFTVSYDDETNSMTQNTSIVLGDLNCTQHANCYKILTKGIDVAYGSNEDLDSDDEEEEEEEEDDETIQMVNCAQDLASITTTFPGFGHAEDTNEQLCGGPRDVKYGTVIDHILSSPDIAVKSFKVLNDVKCENGRRPSTHYPILADLKL
jgi:endonuclease/exonuclease/phosphatase family metal-dependent hydrolase